VAGGLPNQALDLQGQWWWEEEHVVEGHESNTLIDREKWCSTQP
jgi:hypothetical protein